jgi:RNase P protein component
VCNCTKNWRASTPIARRATLITSIAAKGLRIAELEAGKSAMLVVTSKSVGLAMVRNRVTRPARKTNKLLDNRAGCGVMRFQSTGTRHSAILAQASAP